MSFWIMILVPILLIVVGIVVALIFEEPVRCIKCSRKVGDNKQRILLQDKVTCLKCRAVDEK